MFDPGFTNQAPMVTLVSPTNSAVYTSGESVNIVANATDEYEVISVEFIADDISLWIDDSAPYTATNTFSAGEHTIVARATDSSGAISTETVTVTVEDPIFEEPEIANVTRAGSTTTITLSTPVTRTYTLQTSSNLIDWIDVDSQVPVEGTVTLSHETNSEYLFYRAAVLP